MKVVTFNGSPHKDGNTVALLGAVLRELEARGIETELERLRPLSQGAGHAFHAMRKRTAAVPRRGI